MTKPLATTQRKSIKKKRTKSNPTKVLHALLNNSKENNKPDGLPILVHKRRCPRHAVRACIFRSISLRGQQKNDIIKKQQ